VVGEIHGEGAFVREVTLMSEKVEEREEDADVVRIDKCERGEEEDASEWAGEGGWGTGMWYGDQWWCAAADGILVRVA